MKKLLLLLLCYIAGSTVHAQQEALYRSMPPVYFDSAAAVVQAQILQNNPDDTSEGGEAHEFARWSLFFKSRAAYDAPEDSSVLQPYGKGLSYYMKHTSSYCTGSGNSYKGDWKCLGPFTNYYGFSNDVEHAGRIDAVWADTNLAYILAGSDMGGLWKSTDTGHTWHNITDPTPTNGAYFPGTIGVTQLAVNPLDHNIIYLASNIDRTDNRHNGYGLGVFYTLDGGQTWNEDNSFLTANAQATIDYSSKFVQKMAYLPGTEKLFAISANKVLYRSSQAGSWADITPNTSTEYTDMQFSVLSPGKVLVSSVASSGVSVLYIYNVAAQTWSSLNFNPPSGYYFVDGSTGILNFAVTASDSVVLLLSAKLISDSTAYKGLYKAGPGSTALDELFAQIDIYLTGRPQYLVASPACERLLYLTSHDGLHSFYKSVDRGKTFTHIGSWVHADARAILLYKADGCDGVNDVLFGGTDGGVVMKAAGNTVFQSITGDSLAITQFYSLSNSEADEGIITGGAQDNGGYTYVKTRTPPWKKEGYVGGDGFVTKFANNGIKKSLIEGWPEDAAMKRVGFDVNGVNEITSSLLPQGSNNFLRPIHFDSDTNSHVGIRNVWKRNYNLQCSYCWDPTFGADPKQQNVVDFAIQETAQDTAYVAYDGNTSGIDPSEAYQINNPNGKLYRTYNAPGTQTTPPTWTNITMSQVAWNRMTSIAVNEHGMKNIWVALGDVNFWAANTPPGDMTAKVFYSNNAGTTWFDISAGLPPLPVNKILYHDGLNRLYAATDVGVFTCDFSTFNPSATLVNGVNKSVQWICYNNGMPPCVVTDMEFNYCAGKLRVSTFGRGIWETDILVSSSGANVNPNIGDVTPNPTETISANTTWTTDKYIKTGVHVTNNATLTISGSTTTIHMPYNGKIVVEPGAKLVVDGATLTNDCSGFWFGIEALGDPNQAQSPTYQATVELKNGATIEHARFGISNWNHSTLNTGAIITASNTHFYNNHKSVELESYHHANSNTYQLIPYAASFKQCDFVVDDDFRGDALDYLFDTHISMWDVEGVRISGCIFQNNNTGASLGHGYGILSYNAGYKTSTYPTIATRTKFRGFKAGILAEGDAFNAQPTIDVTKTDFDSCSIGIWAKNVHNFSSTECTYDIGYGTIYGQECLHNIGIYSINCHQFTIENNTFTGVGTPPTGWKNVGSYTENSGSNDKEIAVNTFSNLHIACLAQGNNSELYTNLPMVQQSGLRYSCNTYSYNQKDIVVQVASSNQGIAKIQGSLLNGAGNTFTPSGYFYNEGHPIRYFNSGGSTLPTYMSSNIIPLTAPTRNCGNGLPDATDHPPLAPARKTELIAMLYDNIAIRANKQAVYDSLMDGGSMDTLMDYLTGESSFSALDVKDYIMSLSPFVSDSIISYLISSELLPESALLEVLAANPEALQDPDLLDKLLTETELELTQQDLAYLDYLAFSSTAKTAHEVDIADASYQVGYALNRLLADAKEDTTAIATDSMISWLLAVKEPWADYDAAGIMLRHGDIENATTVLEAMPDLYVFDEDENSDYEAFLSLKSLIGDMWDAGRSTNQLDSADIATLEIIANGHRGQNSGEIASAILEANAEEPHEYCAPIYTTYTLSRRYRPQPVPKMHAEGIKVYPNPADRYVIFTYNFPLAKSSLSVRIADVTGKLVQTLPLNGNNGQTIWDTRNTPSGNYVYGVYDGSTAISTGKIVVQRQ